MQFVSKRVYYSYLSNFAIVLNAISEIYSLGHLEYAHLKFIE